MYKIELKGLKELLADVDDLIKYRIPKMLEITINQTGKSLKENTIRHLPVVFDRPVKWTMDSVYFKPATKGDLNAWVFFKDKSAMSGPGTPASKYLWPEVHGGPRNLKRVEKALQRYGALPPGYYTVPGKGVKIDNKSGNMDRGQIVEMLAGIRALEGMANTKFYSVYGGYRLRKKSTANFFVVKQRHGGLFPGIWERLPETGANIGKRKGILTPAGPEARQKGSRSGKFYSVIQGRRVRPILIFVKDAPRYGVRFPFYEWAQEFVNVELPKIFNRVADETLAYWKKKSAGR